jgi:hypothetical protein
VVRRSGRPVEDQEILIAYTPEPLQRSGPQTHVWVAEWQAVPWLGMAGLDDLGSRGGLTLGRYRFHVDGSTWSLDSDPFTVVAGGFEANSPARTGGNIQALAEWHAPKGWRLMDFVRNSNTAVPIVGQAVKMELMNGATVLATANPTSDGNGTVSMPDNATATSVRLTDKFGNVATAPIP